MFQQRTRIWLILLMLMTLFITHEEDHFTQVEAATFTVNNIADTDDSTCNVADCTLREAVNATNAASGADVINFSVSGTITVGTQLTISDDLTINGSGITLDGGDATRIMEIAGGVTAELNGLVFQNGSVPTNNGGALFTGGNLTVNNATFTGNYADRGGAIWNRSIGTIVVNNSTFSDNQVIRFGGAFYNREGDATINNSTFYNNQADTGGAVYNYRNGDITISSSTFSSNLATNTGGSLHHNVASGTGVTGVESSVIVGGNCGGGIPWGDLGNNIAFNATNCPGTVADPQLGPLQNNGGSTDTMLPALTGPAVDAYAAPCATTTDQRGITRPQGTLCDIGATEQEGPTPTDTPIPPSDTPQPPTDTPVPPTDTPIPPTNTPGPMSLVVSAACVDENLAVTISDGDGPFNITASAGINTPVNGVNTGTTTINGPEKWDNLTVTETSGDMQSVNLGQFRCRSDERPVPLSPAHRSRTTNPFPTFSWTSITNANNYRVFVFDDADPATRTVDIRQNSGGPTSMQLSTPLPDGRLFWRVRGRTNRIWSLWSIRFTLFKDPVVPLTGNTVVPTIDLNPPSGDDAAPNPAPTFPAPPNSR